MDNMELWLASFLVRSGLVLGCVWGVAQVRLYWQRRQLKAKYDALIRKVLAEREAKQHPILFEQEPPLHTATTEDNDLLDQVSSWSASQLRDAIYAGKVRPRDVVGALARRCRKYGRHSCNAITEELYQDAADQADRLPQLFTQKQPATDVKLMDDIANQRPLLYGIPISVKDCIAVEGSYATSGLACRLQHKEDRDSVVVNVLKQAGALFLCKGNVPQIMMIPESVNRIFGRTLNPWDRTRSTGGTSGGDAALVAMRCVPMAIGTDVAGGIRIAASFCGVVAFKPTSVRLSGKGSKEPRKNNRRGQSIVIPSALGPITRSVEDCALFCRATMVRAFFEQDCYVPPISFDEAIYRGYAPDSRQVLRIGYFDTDGWFDPCRTSKRAVAETVERLRNAGHECVPFEMPTDGWYNNHILMAINGAEGNFRCYLEALEGEDIIPEYNLLIFGAKLSTILRRIVCSVIDKRRSFMLSSTRSGGITAYEVWQLTASLLEMRSKWADAMRAAKLDALLYPAMPIPAFRHGTSAGLTSSCSYMFLANLLGWPAGTVPVSTVRLDEAHYSPTDLPSSQRDAMSRLTEHLMLGSQGLPISVSIMVPAYRDELCLRVMKEVERLMPFTAQPQDFLSEDERQE